MPSTPAFFRRSMRSAATSGVIRPAYTSMSCIIFSRWGLVSAEALIPTGDNGSTFGRIMCTMSVGASGWMFAVVRCAASRASSSARAKDLLELHDRRRREVAASAEAGLEQVMDERPLRLAHLLDRKPIPREHLIGDEVPLQPLVGVERKNRLLALLGCEGREPLVGRAGHGGRRPLPSDPEAAH